MVNVEDLRRLARRRLPRVLFDYLDGGAEGETTLEKNVRAFQDVSFRPHNGLAIGRCDLKARVLQDELSLPAILAPIGYSRLLNPGGETAAASAASDAGIGYILSTISSYPLESVKTASGGPMWYQLYLVGGREVGEGAIDRARRAGFSALVLTVDTPVAGMRERDVRNGMKELLSSSLFAKLRYVPNILAHPRWLASFLVDGGMPKLENIVIRGKGPLKMVDVVTALSNTVLTWEDLKWIRQVWPGPFVIKGIITAEDARRAVDEGASAIVVSNHGGRQLDGLPASLRTLPEIVSVVRGRTDVLVDGGIRRGSDIIKAICLGARAVLVGRMYAYGLAAAGRFGVSQALRILQDDLERTLKLLGCPSISKLDASYVNIPEHWSADMVGER
jgi:L-lactate dehydrogenase (cytochrome)